MIVDFLSQEAEQQQQPAVAPQAELEQLEAILQVAQEEGSSSGGGGAGHGSGGGSAGYGPKLTLSVEGNISAGKSTFLQILKESGIEEHLQV